MTFTSTNHCSCRVHCKACRDAGPDGIAFRTDKEEAFGGVGECPLALPVGHAGPWPAATAAKSPQNRRRIGPGTALAFLLRLLRVKPWPGCSCEARKRTMNIWGWWGCVRNVATIARWLTERK